VANEKLFRFTREDTGAMTAMRGEHLNQARRKLAAQLGINPNQLEFQECMGIVGDRNSKYWRRRRGNKRRIK